MSKPTRAQRPGRIQRPEKPLLPTPGSLESESLREHRAQRLSIIKDMITAVEVRTQAMLQEMLEKQGILTTQSSISRDLRDLGVRRVKGTYVISPARIDGAWDFEALVGLVEAVTRSGPYNTVIQTIPDAARLVARTIEAAGWDEIVGSVAGESTIFIATRTEEDQNRLFERLKKYLSF